MTEYNDWKIWNGGECPEPEGTMGQMQAASETRLEAESYPPEYLFEARWDHNGNPGDTIACRTVKEPVVEVVCGWVWSNDFDTNYPVNIVLTDGKVTKVELAK